jgi:hypothetical protein
LYLSDGHPTLWNPTLYPYARLKHRSKIKADHVIIMSKVFKYII